MLMQYDPKDYPVNTDHPDSPRAIAHAATRAANEALLNTGNSVARKCPLGCRPLAYFSHFCRPHDDCPLGQSPESSCQTS